VKQLEMFTTIDLIESFPDIVYITDLDGTVIAYNKKNWNAFAITNSAPELADPSFIFGKSIYSFIADKETRDSYKKYSELLIKKLRDSIIFPYRCDAPEVKREMRMAITFILHNDKPAAFIYHSITLNEEHRPPINILKAWKPETGESHIPMLTICSYCKNVLIDLESQIRLSISADMLEEAISTTSQVDNSKGLWVTPEKYYQMGGGERVILNHGICPTCYRDIISPMIAQLKI